MDIPDKLSKLCRIINEINLKEMYYVFTSHFFNYSIIERKMLI